MKQIHLLTCQHCGKQFGTSVPRKYCTRKCQYDVQRRVKYHICQQCGTTFAANEPRKFCSDRCRRQSATINYRDAKGRIVKPTLQMIKEKFFATGIVS